MLSLRHGSKKHLYTANIILINANIITLDRVRPKADWVAIARGKILSLGERQELVIPGDIEAEIIDYRGRTVLPGFIDSHLHLLSFAESLVTLNLKPKSAVGSVADIQSRICNSSRNLPRGNWIRGNGYDEYYLAEKRHPNRWDLDIAALDHPVKLTHRSGHAHVLNSLALNFVGIGIETPDPPGGLIERDLNTGLPTGLLYEMGDFLSARIPPLDNEDLEKGIKMADQELISHGITSICDASSRNDMERWNLFKSWKKKGLLNPRVDMMLGFEGFEKNNLESFSTALHPGQLRVSGVKIILDETTGRLHPSQPELNKMVLEAHQAGRQVAIHAIEEVAIKAACIAIEYAVKRNPKKDHRHRIEHCSLCPPALAKRIASLGITVVTQPPFIYYNAERYLQTVPEEQLRYLYPLRTLLHHGINVAGSSDCPIVPPNPLMGMYAAVSRRGETGDIVGGYEKIPLTEALRMYTQHAARAMFEEGIKGTITPGKMADLVVLNCDPTQLPPDEVKDLKVEMTIVDGQVVWKRGD